ncbi:MAG TPA: hypothetical protein VKB80_36110, partial [Kofleriaceae bacterium]|nr:hypothetical protein [Kofleriaceae bacterium]
MAATRGEPVGEDPGEDAAGDDPGVDAAGEDPGEDPGDDPAGDDAAGGDPAGGDPAGDEDGGRGVADDAVDGGAGAADADPEDADAEDADPEDDGGRTLGAVGSPAPLAVRDAWVAALADLVEEASTASRAESPRAPNHQKRRPKPAPTNTAAATVTVKVRAKARPAATRSMAETRVEGRASVVPPLADWPGGVDRRDARALAPGGGSTGGPGVATRGPAGTISTTSAAADSSWSSSTERRRPLPGEPLTPDASGDAPPARVPLCRSPRRCESAMISDALSEPDCCGDAPPSSPETMATSAPRDDLMRGLDFSSPSG